VKPSIDVVVMYHPLRAERARALADELGARLVGDPRPEFPPSAPGTWRTARAAWTSVARGGADVGLVVQDDVVLCPGFRRIADSVLATHGDRVVAFFSPHPIVLDAFAARAPMVELPWMGWVQTPAVAIPACQAAQLVRECDTMPAHHPDDVRLELWLRQLGVRALATVPSLVQHDPDAATIIPGRRSNAARPARLYVGDTAVDPWAVDWSGPVYGVPGTGWLYPDALGM
jgi:hypothetical protein